MTPTSGVGCTAGNPTGACHGTNFQITLPSGAHCSHDTATGNYKLFSYVVNNATVPVSQIATSLNFSSGAASQGASLIDTGGTPYEQNATLPVSGGVPTPPAFNWDAYAGANDFGTGADLNNGTFNVGIACADPSGVVDGDNFWNTQVTFVGTSPNPPGTVFTWSAQSNPTPEVPMAILVPLSGAAVVGAGVMLMRRRRRLAPASLV
jgi:hypothetical protein